MNYKYRLLLAILITLTAIGCQVVLGQTKNVKKSFMVANTAACNCSLTVKPAVTNPTVCNVTDGSIQLTLTGSTGPFTFQWKDQTGLVISTSRDLINVGPGFYFLQVSDNAAPYCGIFNFNYTLNSNFAITATLKDNTGCTSANGAITLNVTGGSGNYSYKWQLPDASIVNSKNLVNVKAGSYYLTTTDNTLGCTLSKSFQVKSTTLLSVTPNSITENTSCSSYVGAIDIITSGGSGQYSYYWYDLQTYGIASYGEDLTNAKGGNYSAFVTDKISGCTAYQYFSIPDKTKSPQFTIASVTANTNCKGPFNGTINLQPSGTPGPYDITWTDGANVISTLEDPNTLPSGTYGFTIHDQQTNCLTTISVSDTSAVEILDHSLPFINVTLGKLEGNSACGNYNGEIQVTIADPLTPYSFSWTGPNNFTSTTKNLTGIGPGDYILSVTANCNNPPVISLPTLSLQEGSTITLNLLDFITDMDNNLNPSTFQILQKPLSGAAATIDKDFELSLDYSGITFKGTDKLKLGACDLLNACTENILSIEVDATGGDIIVYNAVAPRSSGDNRFMRIKNLPSGGNRVSIFNRWGDLIFETENYDNETRKFEGFSNQGKELPSGTYFYKIEFLNGLKPVTGYLALTL